MKLTFEIEDDLVRQARNLTGIKSKRVLIREAFKALIERESSRRLASLGGTMLELRLAPRSRSQRT